MPSGAVLGAGPESPPAPARRERASGRRLPALEPLYNVVLLDDDEHTYHYVVEMLCTLFGHGFEMAYMMACEVDRCGRVVVCTTDHDEAVRKRDQIHAYGADPWLPASNGSMHAVIEPLCG